ncbi:AraC family transcriptional regulator [Flammeovirga sp. EKP202]|uniref:helix-turn-helix domain-containing protein n=1 Tax=Flammeovirga sp. EKP202 TaxID=2770592 RepID=UPI00165EF6B3|nr:helix-turn-helix domain-containing protein [Flammeovirga sp. EKP202]MBD0403274.1 AraC family transcriptional regulator [Flammeovirga sp. EKP202]
MSEIIRITEVSQIHQFLGLESPKHPLITVLPIDEHMVTANYGNFTFLMDLYQVSLKRGIEGRISYGRNSYDFKDGTMVFTKPNQSMKFSSQENFENVSGWTVIFHPDLIRKSELGKVITNYDFFAYAIYEALHVSNEEQIILSEIVDKIQREYEYIIDRHSQELIVSNIKLLLDYCTRYYDRQFYTRSNLNKDFVAQFESCLQSYYDHEKQLELGVPSVKYFGEELNMSSHYLSDLLKKETGSSAQEHIYNFLMDLAKTKLLSSTEAVGQIAYGLGFEYPNHFSKLFKSKTGMSPVAFRKAI